MRNNYLYFENNARCRSRFVIFVIKKKRLSEERGVIEH